MLLQLAGAAALAIWIYLLLGAADSGTCATPRPWARCPPAAPGVVAVIPARNEALVVARAIGSLARQRVSG